MSEPDQRLKLQLESAYLALEALGRDRAKWQQEADTAREQAARMRDAYQALVDALADVTVRLSKAETQRDEFGGQRDALRAGREALEAQQHKQARERDELARERDALASQRDELARQLNAMRRTVYWRLSKPLRLIEPSVHALPQVLRRAARRSAVAVLDAMTAMAASWRARLGVPRTMWGITPILTLPLLARCDRLLGLRSESLVFETYSTWRAFDINLERLIKLVYGKYPYLVDRLHRVVLRLALVRYDVFHLFCDRGLTPPIARFGINPSEMAAMRQFGRRLYTYTYGADVRTRQTTLALGKYNFCIDCPEPTRFCFCDDEQGRANIECIRQYATAMIAVGDMLPYVPGARDFCFWPIDIARSPNVGTDWVPGRPLRIAHATNQPQFKGTHHLIAAIERLRSEGHAIELVRAEGVPNADVITLFRSCDLVADQFIDGFHGYTSFEAMALGKPVLCYLRSPDMVMDPDHCPMINVWPDTVYDTLKRCLEGEFDLPSLGRRSRSYIERYHSMPAVAIRLGKLYLETAKFPDRINRRISRRIEELGRTLPELIAGPAPVSWAEAARIDGLSVKP